MKSKVKHILIWTAWALFLYLIFIGLANWWVALARTSIVIGFQLITFYVNTEVLLPKLFKKKRIAAFLGTNLAIILLTAFVSMGFMSLVLGDHFVPGRRPLIKPPISERSVGETHPEISDLPFRGPPPPIRFQMIFFELGLTHAAPAILALFIGFLYFSLEEQKRKEQTKALNIKAENDFLISQINPHFLFNALNNIYSYIMDNEEGSKALMRLSKMLEYSIYKGREDRVPLANEVQYIENYIGMFKLRDDEIEHIYFDFSKADLSREIAPMILIPFVENAFKHGNIEGLGDSFIRLKLETSAEKIYFICENTYSDQKKNKDQVSGIGITNVSRRLELIYQKQFNLENTTQDGVYKVQLVIQDKLAV